MSAGWIRRVLGTNYVTVGRVSTIEGRRNLCGGGVNHLKFIRNRKEHWGINLRAAIGLSVSMDLSGTEMW